MSSFTPVVAGNQTLATDINQLINALNGTTNSQVFVQNASGTIPYTATLSSLSSTTTMYRAFVSGDSQDRAALYIASGGFGGIRASNGSGTLYTFLAQSGGWTTPNNLNVGGSFTVSGSGTFAGGTFSSSVTFNGSATFSSTTSINGGVVAALIGGGTKVSVQSSAPGSPSVGDLWVNTSTNLG